MEIELKRIPALYIPEYQNGSFGYIISENAVNTIYKEGADAAMKAFATQVKEDAEAYGSQCMRCQETCGVSNEITN